MGSACCPRTDTSADWRLSPPRRSVPPMATTRYCAACLTTFREEGAACPNLTCGCARPDDGWPTLLAPGEVLDRHYRIERALAVGGAGITYLARGMDAGGQSIPPDLAIKVLYAARATGTFLRRLATEAQILQDLDHDNIVRCVGFVQRASHPPYLVTLFEHGGSLTGHVERVGPLPPRVAAGVLRQILLALDIAHQRGIVHRDLKPDNVLLALPVAKDTVPHVRVADFGIAKVSGGVSSRLTRAGAFMGTPEFAAPEQFRAEAPTPATDVFAAGAVLAYLLIGRPPVAISQRNDLEGSLRELLLQLPPRLPPSADPDIARLQEVLDHTMIANPERRWTAHQVLGALGPVLGAARGVLATLEITTDAAPERWAGPIPGGPSRLPPAPVASQGWPRASESVHAGVELSPLTPPLRPEVPMTPSPIDREDSQRGTKRVGLLAGLGAAGAVTTVVVGGAILLATWATTAWMTGWFHPDGPPRVALDPLVVRVAEQQQLRNAKVLLGGDTSAQDVRRAIVAAVDGLGVDLGRICKGTGPIVGTLWIDPGGVIARARIDPGYAEGACVGGALEGRVVPNRSGTAVEARVAFYLGG